MASNPSLDSLMDSSVDEDDGGGKLSFILKNISKDDYVIKLTSDTGKKSWKCRWCNSVFSGHNATKALFHVSRQKGNDIAKCRGNIDASHLGSYQDLFSRSISKKTKRANTRVELDLTALPARDPNADVMPHPINSLQKCKRAKVFTVFKDKFGAKPFEVMMSLNIWHFPVY